MISINSTLIEVSFIGYVNNKFGAGNRNRTRDLLLTRQLLYLLSYTGIECYKLRELDSNQ